MSPSPFDKLHNTAGDRKDTVVNFGINIHYFPFGFAVIKVPALFLEWMNTLALALL